MDPSRRMPSPDDRPSSRSPEYGSPEYRSPEYRPPSKPPPQSIAPRLIREVLAIPPQPRQALPPPPLPDLAEERAEQARPLSPAAVTVKRLEMGANVAEGRNRMSWEEAVINREEVTANRANREAVRAVTKVEEGRRRAEASILRRSWQEVVVEKAGLGFRVLEIVFCLISFSVMAADKTRGWAGDSFDRYKEYRFCLSMTVIGFVYSGFQGYALTQHLISGKHIIQLPIRYYFDFVMDQILAYLLMSASSSSATRTDNWVLNYGEDEFTKMATASISMSFLAFFAFAFSAMISGYDLCHCNS